jgi:hypothetical protein
MKKLVLTTLMSVAAAAAFAQGTVTFLNDTVTLSTPPDRLIRFGAAAAASLGVPVNAPAFGTNMQVQLYYGASTDAAASLVPLTASPARLRGSTSAGVGTWLGGTRTFQSAGPGAVLNMQVRVWDINFGTTYENATGGIKGTSGVFLYTVPQPTDPSGNFAMSNFGGFTIDGGGIIPEPTTFALAGLGAAAMLIYRRRK